MLRPRSALVGLALLALVGCFGDDPELGSPATDTVPAVGPGPSGAPSPDSADPVVDSLAADSVAVVQDAAAALDTLTSDQALERLLLQVAAGQMALEQRLDELDARLEGALETEGPDVAADSERIVGAAQDTALNLGFAVAWTILTLLIMRVVIGFVVWVLDRLAERYPRSRLFWKRLVPIVRILAWGAAGFFIVRFIFEVDAQGLVAAAAALGVAIGFAAQDLLKNLFGGLILVFDQPFQVGDKISVGGTYGEVVSIGIRSTRIVTPDDNLVSVPNAQVVDGQVANANAGQLNCQVVTDLYLPGTVDEARAKKIAFEAATSSKYVYLSKPIVVLVKDEFKETFITHIKVKAYVLDPRYEFLFQSDVTERARAGFRDAGLMTPAHALRAYLDLSRTSPGPAAAESGAAEPAAAESAAAEPVAGERS